nr:GH25 family lysozyme [Mesorhizobium sp.]
MRRIVALLLIASLAGCTGSGGLQELAPSSSDAPIASGPRFADRDPHDWQARKPWDYAIHGTDVSKYQTAVDWAAARAKGISFAFVKATEGGDRVDDNFHEHWRNARAAGIPRGAYHFFYFCRPAAEQAEWFIRNVPRERGSLPPVLDMEWNPLSPTCTLRPPPETVRSEMRIFLNIVQKHYGKRPIIYTDPAFFDRNGLNAFRGYHFWLRSTAGHPTEKYGDHPFVFWQYTGTGTVPGVPGDADINVFNGSASGWRAWLKANAH